ncbi:hypothetical protein KQX54_013825, partial [Cotesia glomerata]
MSDDKNVPAINPDGVIDTPIQHHPVTLTITLDPPGGHSSHLHSSTGVHVSDSDLTDDGIKKNDPPADPEKKTKTRTKSTAKSRDLEFKIVAQMSRLRAISDAEAISAALTVTEGSAALKAELLEHSYVKDGVFDLAHRSFTGTHTRLSTLINLIAAPAQKSIKKTIDGNQYHQNSQMDPLIHTFNTRNS